MPGSSMAGTRAVLVAVGLRLALGLVAVSVLAGAVALLDVAAYQTAWGGCAVAVGALMGVTANDVMSRGAGFDAGTVLGGGCGTDPTAAGTAVEG